MKQLKGFTLVELLVVISIIGILASIVLISFTSSQKQARDSQRKSDIKQYQLALENFANKNGGIYVSRTNATGVTASTTLCTDLGLTTCPQDPRNPKDTSFTYLYQSDGTGSASVTATRYVLWGKIENVSTTTYWVVCSNGKNGQVTTGVPPSTGTCPL